MAKVLERALAGAWRDAAFDLRQHGEHEAARALPAIWPYSLDQIIGRDWYPANRHGILDDDGEP